MEGQPIGQGRAPEVWLAKAEGPDSVSSDSQQDFTCGILTGNSSALGERGRQEDTGRRIVEHWNTELSSVGE